MTPDDAPMTFNPAWQMVTCAKCRRHYRCTPKEDYARSAWSAI